MALDDAQKAFYDTKRQFQGRDDPDAPPSPDASVARSGVPRGQLIGGLLILGLIVLAFFMFEKTDTEDVPAPAPAAAPAVPAPAPH